VSVLLAHARAVRARLDTDNTAPALVVLAGKVPSGVLPPYVLVYIRLRTPEGRAIPAHVSLEATSDVIDTSAYCHCVGDDQDAALSVADRVRGLLLGVELTIAGRACFPIVHADSSPEAMNEQTGLDYVDHVDVYEFRSIPT
jgi:hypothetical protein